jgi:hypothetical protein
LTCVPFLGREAVAAGLVTRRQLAGDAWRRLFPDVYASSGLELDHRLWCIGAGLLLADRGAVSGRSAAALWGTDVLVRGAPIEVTVPRSIRIRAGSRLAVIRSELPTADIAAWAGIPVTNAVRTAFDLGRRPPLTEAVVALDAMLAARLVTHADLARFTASHAEWPGSRRLRLAVRLSDSGAASPMESRMRMVLIAGGLPRPVTQFEVYDEQGLFVARLDMAYPRKRLGIEYEGDHHRGPAAFQHDLRRINALRACGWTVLRFGSRDIYREPAKVVAMVRRVLMS